MSQSAGSNIQDGRPTKETFAIVLLIFAPLFFGSNTVMGRAAIDVMPPVALAFWRWVVAALILLPFTWRSLREHAPVLRENLGLIALLGSLGMGVCGSCVYIGLQYTPAASASILYAITPVLMLLIVWMTEGEKARLDQVIGVLIAIAGVLTIVSRGDLGLLLSTRFSLGDIWVLGSAVSWAVYSILLRRLSSKLPTFTLFTAVVLAGIVSLAPFYALESLMGRPVVVTGPAILSIVGVAFIASVLAFSAFQKGIAVIGAVRGGPFMYLLPVYGVALAVIFLGERIEAFHGVGLCLVLGGVALAGRRVKAA